MTAQLVFLLYLASLLVIGEMAARRGGRKLEEYLLAGRREGPLLLAATVSATVIGAGSTLGAAGAAYYVGISAGWYLWSASLGLLLLGLVFAGRLQGSGVYTVPEFLERRYGPAARAVATALGLVGLVIFLAAQLFALGTIIRTVTGLRVELGILLGSAVTIAYTTRGGNRAVHWSDAFQLGWILAGVLVAAGVGLVTAGGLDALRAPPSAQTVEASSMQGWFNPYTGGRSSPWNPFALGSTVLGWIVMSTTWHFTMQSTAQRLLSARDARTAVRACVLAALFLLPLAALVALTGMTARLLVPALPPTADFAQSDALPALVRTVLPGALAGVVLAALVAAVMSTADSVLLGASTSALIDGVRRFLRPSLSDEAVLRGTQRATLVIGVVAAGLALWAQSLVEMLELVAAVYAGSVFAPLVLGLFWKRATETGAILGIGMSAAVAVAWRMTGLEAATGLHMLLLSLPIGFSCTWIGTVTLSSRSHPRRE